MAKRSRRIMHEFCIKEISAVDQPAQQGAKALIMKRKDKTYDDDELDTTEEGAGEGNSSSEPAPSDRAARNRKKKRRALMGKVRDALVKNLDTDALVREVRAIDRSSEQPQAEQVKKSMRLLSVSNGHTHLLDDTAMDNRTSWEKAPDDEYGHSHPWVRGADGNIVIGEADGHNHTILEKRLEILECDGQEVTPAPGGVGKSANGGDTPDVSKENVMTEEEKAALAAANKRATELEASLALAKAFGALNDAERTYHNNLPESERAGFLAKSASERSSLLTKAAGDNPVVYTAQDGSEFRKNDDPRLISMAKQNDANAKAARDAQSALADSALAKRAETELAKLPGESAIKVALLKAVDGIADQKTREGVQALLKAGNDAMAKSFERIGTQEVPVGGSVNDKLEALAKQYSADHKVDIVKARAAVLDTPEGNALYGQLQAQPKVA